VHSDIVLINQLFAWSSIFSNSLEDTLADDRGTSSNQFDESDIARGLIDFFIQQSPVPDLGITAATYLSDLFVSNRALANITNEINALAWVRKLGVSLTVDEIQSSRTVLDLAKLIDHKAKSAKAPGVIVTPGKSDDFEGTVDADSLTRGSQRSDIEYRVWFGTNRRRLDGVGDSLGYSSERGTTTSYGTCRVFVPIAHKIGSLGSSWLHRLITGVDDRLHLLSIEPLAEDEYWRAVRSVLDRGPPTERPALVFIHGYNVTFENAALKAAQIGCDLSVDALVAFFSWPSMGTLGGYLADAAAIEASELHITDFLVKFACQSGASSVHIIAHSMGNRGVLRALNNIANRAQALTDVRFGQVILAAADVDSGTFQSLCGAFVSLAKRATLYISGRDRAVEASRWLHDFARVGLMPPIFVVPGIDTVSVTNADLTMLGHGYVGEARDVLQDIHRLLVSNDPPERRFGLRKDQTQAGDPFWTIGN
jgi:esterase/lipase superfamily enzyme